jgi:multidrug transporter EmrE-like cation transporter
MTALVLATLAASCFTLGGVFMKQADGLRHAGPATGFLVLFALGAVVQSQAMRGAELAVTYVIVLGLEAALAVALGRFVFGEPMTAAKLCAIALIVAGIALLRTR